jgi:hypothetical protein
MSTTNSCPLLQAEIDNFVKYTDEMYVCISAAQLGLNDLVEKMRQAGADPTKRLFVGPSDPNHEPHSPSILIGNLIENGGRDGSYVDLISKSVLVSIFSTWDEFYRPKLAKIAGVKTNSVACDILGEIRIVRNVIVHGNSNISKQKSKLKILSKLFVDDEIRFNGQNTFDLFKLFKTIEVKFDH